MRMIQKPFPSFWSILLFLFFLGACQKDSSHPDFAIDDPNILIELIATEPDIVTPIGLTFGPDDALYVLESHTHSPLDDYQGPTYDRIKKGIDSTGDGKPNSWHIYADSLEDGMNLFYHEGVYVSTKRGIYQYQDTNKDHQSDRRITLAEMVEPESVYDHAGILGLTIGPDNWVYFSRGNTGGQKWRIMGSDSLQLEGYGDGGNVMRCRLDGSQIEEIATGFWNPFDLHFTQDGRLLLTDNDPDSRGPNRLIEVVPGGQYGYESLYGGSGIHPYLSWNGELPGTLPYAAPLGEAPCSLWEGDRTSLGSGYQNQILVNIWEENAIVRIPLTASGSSVYGEPVSWIQGGKDFHPVDLATNSKGELFVSDWVMRQYPNHGKGKIWRIRSNATTAPEKRLNNSSSSAFAPFSAIGSDPDTLLAILRKGDPFQKAWVRRMVAQQRVKSLFYALLDHPESDLRLEGLLTAMHFEFALPQENLTTLLRDENPSIRRMAMIYAGKMGREEVRQALEALLDSGAIGADQFETYLATVRHLQPEFIQGRTVESERLSRNLSRKLPEAFLPHLITDTLLKEEIRSLALPYLKKGELPLETGVRLLLRAQRHDFQIGLVRLLANELSPERDSLLIAWLGDKKLSSKLRIQALLNLRSLKDEQIRDLLPILEEGDSLLSYALVKYLCSCDTQTLGSDLDASLNTHPDKPYLQEVWDQCKGKASGKGSRRYFSEDGKGNAARGEIVYQSASSQCSSCHKIAGWGGTFGPELTNVGASKSISQLQEAILNPSSEISPEWQSWYVVDSSGTRHLGRQIDVHLHNVELMNLTGKFDTYPSPQEYGPTSQSLMPDGLELEMTPAEFQDLIAYLSSLK